MKFWQAHNAVKVKMRVNSRGNGFLRIEEIQPQIVPVNEITIYDKRFGFDSVSMELVLSSFYIVV